MNAEITEFSVCPETGIVVGASGDGRPRGEEDVAAIGANPNGSPRRVKKARDSWIVDAKLLSLDAASCSSGKKGACDDGAAEKKAAAAEVEAKEAFESQAGCRDAHRPPPPRGRRLERNLTIPDDFLPLRAGKGRSRSQPPRERSSRKVIEDSVRPPTLLPAAKIRVKLSGKVKRAGNSSAQISEHDVDPEKIKKKVVKKKSSSSKGSKPASSKKKKGKQQQQQQQQPDKAHAETTVLSAPEKDEPSDPQKQKDAAVEAPAPTTAKTTTTQRTALLADESVCEYVSPPPSGRERVSLKSEDFLPMRKQDLRETTTVNLRTGGTPRRRRKTWFAGDCDRRQPPEPGTATEEEKTAPIKTLSLTRIDTATPKGAGAAVLAASLAGKTQPRAALAESFVCEYVSPPARERVCLKAKDFLPLRKECIDNPSCGGAPTARRRHSWFSEAPSIDDHDDDDEAEAAAVKRGQSQKLQPRSPDKINTSYQDLLPKRAALKESPTVVLDEEFDTQGQGGDGQQGADTIHDTSLGGDGSTPANKSGNEKAQTVSASRPVRAEITTAENVSSVPTTPEADKQRAFLSFLAVLEDIKKAPKPEYALRPQLLRGSSCEGIAPEGTAKTAVSNKRRGKRSDFKLKQAREESMKREETEVSADSTSNKNGDTTTSDKPVLAVPPAGKKNIEWEKPTWVARSPLKAKKGIGTSETISRKATLPGPIQVNDGDGNTRGYEANETMEGKAHVDPGHLDRKSDKAHETFIVDETNKGDGTKGPAAAPTTWYAPFGL